MICYGEIINLNLNFKNHLPDITLEVDANAADLEQLQGEQLSIEIKRTKKKRSLEANNYHYALCTQIARKQGLSVACVHNLLLRECNYRETVSGMSLLIPLPDTEETEKKVLEAETYHLGMTSETKLGKDGKMYRTYYLLRGSHDFNTEEMSFLIDRTIEMAKEQGIETLTPNQRMEMLALYEKRSAG